MAENFKTSEERVVFVIITDGIDNSSKKVSRNDIINKISSHESSGADKWTFVYIGAKPEMWHKYERSMHEKMHADKWVDDDPERTFEILTRTLENIMIE